jgi:DNA polymerase I-like protein with 3'-5' exonuclease and polymerase domains
MTRFPSSDWAPPDLSTLPDKLYGTIGVDTETQDLGLSADQGGGWAWAGGGRVVGYSVAADNFSCYLPIGHDGGGNVDPDQARRWLNHVLGGAAQTKVFAHAMYDLGWSSNDGVVVRGPIIDVQWIEALLDEHRLEYSLDAIARDRLGEGKDETLLRDAARAYGIDPKSELSKMHSRFVGPYATWDAEAPRRIWEVQRPLVEAEGLGRVLELEHRLLPMYMMMRRRGVLVDQSYAERLREDLSGQVEEELREIRNQCGRAVDIWAPRSVAAALKAEGVDWPWRTKNGEPSVTKDLLESSGHWLAKCIVRARELDKLVSTFLDGQVIGAMHGGRVHGQIHPLKSDDGGTVTGRCSMSDPNMQFIPARTEVGKKIRRCFVADLGEEWGSIDYNQQEVRLLVHYACLQAGYEIERRGRSSLAASAFEARDRYVADPKLNYHKFVAEITSLEYKAAKILNFAIIYGRGIRETAEALGKTYDETKALFARHAEKMPFAKVMSNRCRDRVEERGYIRSMTGRRMRFPHWEPADWDSRTGMMLPLEQAKEMWPDQRLARARIHKALNSLIQPAAADQMKLGMAAVLDAGLAEHVLIQVHDELDVSVPDRKIAEQIAECMRDAVKLEVPSLVDIDYGANWGECT